MINRQAIEQILAQYEKHDWKLRRVLLSERLRESGFDLAPVFGNVDTRTGELDGLWFSRSSRPHITAWELRHLAETPYAVVENIKDGTDEAEIEAILKRAETKMIEAVQARPRGN